MKIFLVSVTVLCVFSLSGTSAEYGAYNTGDDQAAADGATLDKIQTQTEDIDKMVLDDSQKVEILTSPQIIGQPLSVELFKAIAVSNRITLPARALPYPPIIQGGRPTRQIPPAFRALRVLKDHKHKDGRYPRYHEIPDPKSFNCENVHQAGFYADEEFGCQVFRRCDLDSGLTSYLCPVKTLFNQITLVCDWYYNIQCSRSSDFYDYSNSRLYHVGWPLLSETHRASHNYDHGHNYDHQDNGYEHIHSSESDYGHVEHHASNGEYADNSETHQDQGGNYQDNDDQTTTVASDGYEQPKTPYRRPVTTTRHRPPIHHESDYSNHQDQNGYGQQEQPTTVGYGNADDEGHDTGDDSSHGNGYGKPPNQPQYGYAEKTTTEETTTIAPTTVQYTVGYGNGDAPTDDGGQDSGDNISQGNGYGKPPVKPQYGEDDATTTEEPTTRKHTVRRPPVY